MYLNQIESFGTIAAEDDNTLLSYFLSTDATARVESGNYTLVLGRKGSGKTALVKHFTEKRGPHHGQPLSLRNYPWTTHGKLVDVGASRKEAYVASWRLLIAISIVSLVCKIGRAAYTDKLASLTKFLQINFGAVDPDIRAIIEQGRLEITGLSLSPTLLGFGLGSINYGGANSRSLGFELNALADVLLKDVSIVIDELGIGNIFLHFDELDQGLDVLDEERANLVIGLVLAARQIAKSHQLRGNIKPIVYLRTDIWDQLDFSDKNKITQTNSLNLSWDSDSLKRLVSLRISSALGNGYAWESLDDGTKMRGSQTKWAHIVARTLLRPRDVIHFLNVALNIVKGKGLSQRHFFSEDINNARLAYSNYLKSEFDDEIKPHWKEWGVALRCVSQLQKITFDKQDFVRVYDFHKSTTERFDSYSALEWLYKFSVIGYERRFAKGGSGWSFKYNDTASEWDGNAPRFKVHIGLKEHAKLKEERA